MSMELLLGIIGFVGAVLGSVLSGIGVAITNRRAAEKKAEAEAEKLYAEAEKLRAEAATMLSKSELEKITAVSQARLPDGWIKAGSQPGDYEVGTDYEIAYSGNASGYIRSYPSPQGFGTLMQTCKPDKYLGKRVRMSGYVKAEGVTNWAGLWLRVDGADGESVSFDNMGDRPISGTRDWRKYEIVLDVPPDSKVGIWPGAKRKRSSLARSSGI